ncbi:MAG: alpha/beta hydrolase [Pseudomonadota bacterium]
MEEAPLYTELAEAPAHGEAFWMPLRYGAIRVATWSGGTRGTAIIFTGRTEYIEKYGRVIRSLHDRGFSVATLDWRGQGLSHRSLGDEMKGHVGDFARYLTDVKLLMSSPAVAALPKPHVLICHSMGGCIGMRALLEEAVRPAAVVMSAPMLGIQMKPHVRLGAKVMTALAERFHFETMMAPAPQGRNAYVAVTPFEANALTNDFDHYEWLKKHLEAEPGFALGPPTLGWMNRATEEMRALRLAPEPEPSILMFLGNEEEVVSPAAIRRYAKRSARCRMVEIQAAKHEVFMETPGVQEIVWREIDQFLKTKGV